jgi:hypothetical protein
MDRLAVEPATSLARSALNLGHKYFHRIEEAE